MDLKELIHASANRLDEAKVAFGHGYGSAVTVTASFGLVAASLVVNYLATGLAKPKI